MDKDFKDIYNKIYTKNKIAYLEKYYQKRGIITMKLFGIVMLGGIIFSKSLLITLPAFIIYLLMTSSKEQLDIENKCIRLYKEQLILPLFKEIFGDVQYLPNEGILLDKYMEAEYKDHFENVNEIESFESNDHIIFPIEINGKNIGNLDIYDVNLERSLGDSSATLFNGLIGVIELPKNIQTKIKLDANVITNFVELTEDKNTIYTEVNKFNKRFSLIAEDKNMAMRIFTPDIMEELLDIMNVNKNYFYINIINNKLYVRVPCFSAFESVIILGAEKYTHVESSFTALEIMKELVCIIYRIIDELEV